MKKLYSQKLKSEVYALSPEQLEKLRQNGYTVPRPEEVIADAGAVQIKPPEGKRAYVVLNFKTGAFSVRVRGAAYGIGEIGALVGDIINAGMVARFVENADPDRAPSDPGNKKPSPIITAIVEGIKGDGGDGAAPTAPTSPFVAAIIDGLKKSIVNSVNAHAASPAADHADDSGEVVE